MKILHLRATNFYGGPERQLHMHALKAAGTEFEVILGSFMEKGNTPEFLEIASRDKIETHQFPVRSAYDFESVRLIRDFILEREIDIICTHDYRSHILVLWSARALRKKGLVHWVAFSRGWTNDTLRVRVYTILEKLSVRFANHIVAVSRAQKARLQRLLISPEKISVAYNCIDTSRFRDIKGIELRKVFDLPADSIVLVSAGRFSREKGQLVLVKAMSEAVTVEPKLRLVMFGDGPDFRKVLHAVKLCGLEGKVICPGFKRELLQYLKGADILVNPSLSEGLPNIVLEAMALGVPVIATSVGGVPELINDKIEGLLVQAGNADELSKGILALALDRVARQRLAKDASARIEKDFNFARQTESIFAVYSTFRRAT